jgi:HK97 gp10 family phage protein
MATIPANSFTVELKNVDKLISELQKLKADIDGAVKDAVMEAALVVEREAKKNAERGGSSYPHRITSNLYNSIKVLNTTDTPGKHQADIGTDMVYGPRLEFGFIGTDSRGRRYNQGPRAFLRPAIDENEAEILRAFEKSLEAALRKYK